MSPPHGLRAEHPDNEANTPRIIPSKPKKAQANLEDDDDLDAVDMDAVAVDMQEYLDDEEMMDDVDSDDDNFLCGEDDDSDLTSPASGGPFVFEETGHESEGVNVGIRDQFKEYVEDHVGNFLPFSKDEVTAIKLLSVLKLKKAPINAYKSLMEWHLKQKGELQYYQGIQDSKTYISREKILKKLSDRYNYGWMYPYKKKIKLPVSGTVIRQTLHYTGSVFQSLLTDPRLEDADYLFYDENPLAPPDAFAAPACVVPDIGGPPNRYYVIEPRTTWHEHFINFIESPHEEMDTLPSDQESDFEEDGSDFEDEAAPEKEAKNKNKL